MLQLITAITVTLLLLLEAAFLDALLCTSARVTVLA